jgi:tetratricopeptide (TPR) repeat protein
MPQSLSFRSSISHLPVRVGLGLLIALTAGSLSSLEAQDDFLNPTDLESTSSGNVTQSAQMAYSQGMRLLDQAVKAGAKATEAETDKQRQKLEKRSHSAYEEATQQFLRALRQDSDVFEAYESLGLAFRKLGRYQEALEIHAIALRRDENSMENFSGWAESMMELNMLGNATQAYTAYAESESPRAPILMAAMKQWLVAREADPGDMEPADIERMAEWIAQQETGG